MDFRRLIFFTSFFILSTCDILPTYYTGVYLNQITWVVELQVGTLTKKIKAVIDRSGSELITAFVLDNSISRSYGQFGDNIDIVLIGSEEILFNVVYNPTAPSLYGCSDCSAVLGVGSASPIYLHYTTVLYTPGSILLDESTDSFDYLSRGDGKFECELFTPEPCVTTGTVLGYTVRILFGQSNEPHTLLPGYVYDKYVGTRSLAKNSTDEWNDLVIKIPVVAGSGDTNQIILRKEHIVAQSSFSGRQLTIAVNPDNTTVVLGRPAQIDYMLRLHRSKKTATVKSILIEKHDTLGGLLGAIVMAVLFHRWRGTPSGMWGALGYQAPGKIFVLGFTMIASVVFYSMEEYQDALEPFPVVNVYIGVVIFGMVLWSTISVFVYFAWVRNLFGFVEKTYLTDLPNKVAQIEPMRVTASEKKTHEFRLENLKGSNLFDFREFCKHPVRCRKSNDTRHSSKVNSFMLVEGTEQVSEKKEKTKKKEVIVRFNPRLWTVSSIAVESVVLTLTLLVFLETRAEALWGITPTLFILYILHTYLYYFCVMMGLGRGPTSVAWVGFQVYMGSIIVGTFIVAQKYIVGPTVERFFEYTEIFTVFGSATLYLAIVFWSFWAASNTLLLYDKRIQNLQTHLLK